ncbi:MAG: nucleoside recognition domain-containing protein [Bacillota bacterium]|nr:nucleoside recognition domain-containing protein [Bacillota bacterium]
MNALDLLARWTVPLLLAAIPLHGYLRGVDIYNAFIDGAREGLSLAIRVLPYIVSIFVAIGIFRASGALELTTHYLQPVLRPLGIPPEILPLMIIRPLSGNGALALTTELLHRWGPDSFVGRLASVITGSTDTTFYILSLYFGSVGVTRSRHALAAGLIADGVGFLAAALTVKWLFGGA